MIESSTRFITTRSADTRVRLIGLTSCYLAILAGVFVLATLGAFDTPSFVYQGF
jgi:hypothetical protein